MYVAALRDFEHDLGSSRTEQMMANGGSILDLVSMFEVVLKKQMDAQVRFPPDERPSHTRAHQLWRPRGPGARDRSVVRVA